MIPVPLKPDVTKRTCLSPIAAASGPAFSYAPAPRSDLGCLKNSLIGNSYIREVSTNLAPLPLCSFCADRPESRTQVPKLHSERTFVICPYHLFPENCYYNVTAVPLPTQH